MIQTELQTGVEQIADQEEKSSPDEAELVGEEFEQYAIRSHDNLPDVNGFSAGVQRQNGSTRYVDFERLVSPPGIKSERPENGEISCKAVLSGVSSYVDRYGVSEIEVPRYYSRFDEFDPILYKWTLESNSVGKGVGTFLLKGLVRMANGSGRIDSEKTRAIICENETLLVTGPRGTFFKDMSSISPRDVDIEPPQSVYRDICGFSIPEESEEKIAKLEQFINVINEYGQHNIVEYEYDGSGCHHLFRASDGELIYFRPSWLRDRQPLDEILGEKETSLRGESYHVQIGPEDIEYDIGEGYDQFVRVYPQNDFATLS